jgi:SAM-dependent methyltransferase
MSDWEELAGRLSKRTGYTNTYYDKSPSLDLKNITPADVESCDFVICSEVLEHVTPPVQPAFDGIYRILKPGGTLVLTVPYRTGSNTTVEHFPMLNEFGFADVGGRRVLVNRRADGRYEVFDDLCFHDGIGSTLEMRVFSEADLLGHLQQAGFQSTVLREPYEPFGILHLCPWSLPIIARKPAEPRA